MNLTVRIAAPHEYALVGELTADGTAMVGFARSILDAQDRAARYFEGSTLTGRLRFGAAEDLVAKGLPQILRDFRRTHPLVDLQLTVGLSRAVHAQLRAGDLDLAFVMRRPGEPHGDLVWRDRLVWGGTAVTMCAPRPLWRRGQGEVGY